MAEISNHIPQEMSNVYFIKKPNCSHLKLIISVCLASSGEMAVSLQSPVLLTMDTASTARQGRTCNLLGLI